MDETTYMSEITSARKTLLDNCDSLEEVANFCEDNYIQAQDKHVALEETKNYATQSLASVAYQINTLATSMLQMLDVTASRLGTIDQGMNAIGLTIDLHDERVGRQAFKTALQCPNDYVRHEKMTRPQWASGKQPAVSHVSTPIDYSSLDNVGHGLKLGMNPSPRNSRCNSSASLQSQGSPHSTRKQDQSHGGSPINTSSRYSLSPDDYVATANGGATIQRNHIPVAPSTQVPPAPPTAPPPPPQIPDSGRSTSDSLRVPGSLSPSNNVDVEDVDDIPPPPPSDEVYMEIPSIQSGDVIDIPPPPLSIQVNTNVPLVKAEEIPAPPPPPSNQVNNNVLTTKAEDIGNISPPLPLMSPSEDIYHTVGGEDLPSPPKSEPGEVYQNANVKVQSIPTSPMPDSGGSNQIKSASPAGSSQLRKSPSRKNRSLARPMKKPPPPPPAAPPPPPPGSECDVPPPPPTISLSPSTEARKSPSTVQARTEMSNPTYADIPSVPQPPPPPPMPSQDLDHVTKGGRSAIPPPPPPPPSMASGSAASDGSSEIPPPPPHNVGASFEDQLKQRLASRQTEEAPELQAVISGDPGRQSGTEFLSQEEPEWAPQEYNSKVVAIFDYEALREDEMSLKEGDIIYITNDFNDGWLMGVNNGVTAMIPGNYVEQMP